MLTLDSWVDATELTGINTEEDVVKRGFNFTGPVHGWKVGTGSLEREKYSKCT